jgi:hypothetical protein
VDTTSGQLVQCSGNFSNGSSEPIYRNDDKLVGFTEPADTFRPARPVAPGASGGGVGEHSLGCDACGCNGVVLLVDALLAGGHPEVRSGAHGY